jgi:hypothetical protein
MPDENLLNQPPWLAAMGCDFIYDLTVLRSADPFKRNRADLKTFIIY